MKLVTIDPKHTRTYATIAGATIAANKLNVPADADIRVVVAAVPGDPMLEYSTRYTPVFFLGRDAIIYAATIANAKFHVIG